MKEKSFALEGPHLCYGDNPCSLCFLTFPGKKMLCKHCSHLMKISHFSASDKSFPMNVITRWGFFFNTISHFFNWILYITIEIQEWNLPNFLLTPHVQISRVLCPQHRHLLPSRAVSNGGKSSCINCCLPYREGQNIPGLSLALSVGDMCTWTLREIQLNSLDLGI